MKRLRNPDIIQVKNFDNDLFCVARRIGNKYFLVDEEGENTDSVEFFSHEEAHEILEDIYRHQNKSRVYVLIHNCFTCYVKDRPTGLFRDLKTERIDNEVIH